jgi:hypothetical protein
MPKLRGTSFNDTLVRNAVIKFFKEKFDITLISNKQEKKIDLLEINDSEFGVEVEHGKWSGNFWENDSYSLISGQKFRTVNIPARKEKYWMEYVTKYKKTKYNPSWKKNLFVRTNKDFTQFILIRPETISNSKKLLRTQFQPNNSNEIENWLSFKKQHVETYNLVKGVYILN